MELARAEALAHWALGDQASGIHFSRCCAACACWRMAAALALGIHRVHAHPRPQWSPGSLEREVGGRRNRPLSAGPPLRAGAIPSGKPADPFFA